MKPRRRDWILLAWIVVGWLVVIPLAVYRMSP